MEKTIKKINSIFENIKKLNLDKDKLKKKTRILKDSLEVNDKMVKHIDKIKEIIKTVSPKEKEKLLEQKNNLEEKVNEFNKKDIVIKLNKVEKKKGIIENRIKSKVKTFNRYKKKLGEEKRNIDAKIKNYENLKNHDKKLTDKIKSLEKEKNKIKEKSKIVDTDHDGVNDKREVRGDDGQLKTNPDKGDIKKGKLEELKKREKELTNEINKLKKQRKKVRKKIKDYKIDKLKSRSKKIGAALKVVTKTKKQMLQLTGNDELEKTARVLS